MRKLGVALSLVLLLAGLAPAGAQSNTKTLNGKDGVQIAKITPRTNAEIALPVRDFVFFLEVQARVVTTPGGRTVVRFYRYSPRTLKLVAVAPPLEHKLRNDQGERWVMQSKPITLTDAQPDERLYVKAALYDKKGRLVSWSESFNTVRGSVSVTPSSGPASADRVRALPGTTAPNTALPVSAPAEFVVRVRYEVKSSPRGVISVEFGELNDIRAGRPWSVSVIEVPAGTGEVELRRSFPLSPALKGTVLAVAVALRNDPLSGASARLELQPYPVGM